VLRGELIVLPTIPFVLSEVEAPLSSRTSCAIGEVPFDFAQGERVGACRMTTI
jgi:hypothetical protein